MLIFNWAISVVFIKIHSLTEVNSQLVCIHIYESYLLSTYLRSAGVFLIQAVVLPALLLILLMINLQSFSHFLYAVLFHQLRLKCQGR